MEIETSSSDCCSHVFIPYKKLTTAAQVIVCVKFKHRELPDSVPHMYIVFFKVPNLFATDEKQDIVEKMRQVDRQRDKAKQTDGTPNALFSLFVGKMVH